MRTLKFIVDGQILKPDPSCGFKDLVPGSAECVKAEFSFSSDWNLYSKVIAFTSALGRQFPPQLLRDGRSCIIPKEALARRVFKVSVIGMNGDKKLTTNKVEVKQDGGKV